MTRPAHRRIVCGVGSRQRLAMVGLAAVLLPLMVAVSVDYGVTYDELPRQTYGEWIWQLYKGHRTLDQFRPEIAGDNSYLYGGLFDVAAVAFQKVVPADPYVVRHGLNAFVGWLGIVFCGVLAMRLAGGTAGVLAMLLLTLTPRYWGEAMNNPKDIPFAAWYTAALAVTATIPARYPYLSTGRALQLGVAIGLALTVRAGALLLLAYACVVVLAQVIRARDAIPRHVAVTFGMMLLVTAIATTLPLPVWPWLALHPYAGLIQAILPASPNGVGRQMLFAGGVVESTHLPWTYAPIWLLYTTPLVVLVGALLAGRWLIKPSRYRVATCGLFAATVFPVAYVIVTGTTLYDGARHLLLVRPALAALAAVGWLAVLEARSRAVVAVGAIALVAGLAEPLTFSVRNHPNQTVYFNAFTSGPQGASGKFDLDTWGNCLLQAEQHVAGLAREAGMRVVIPGHRWRMIGLNATRLPELVVDESGGARYHLEILLVHGTPEEIRDYGERGPRVAAVTTADGAVLCTVVAGPAFQELANRRATGPD